MNARLLRLSACVLALGLACCKGPSPAPEVSAHEADATVTQGDTGSTKAVEVTARTDDATRAPEPGAGDATLAPEPGAGDATLAPEPGAGDATLAPQPKTADATLAPEPKADDATRADDATPPGDLAPPSPAATPRPLTNLPRLSPGSGPLQERLLAEVGQGLPVAILPTPVGLVAMSSDGTRTVLLVEGDVPWALVDHEADVVWFALPSPTARDADATIDLVVLDLRAATPDLVVIARGLVDGSQVGVEYLDPGKRFHAWVPWPTLRYGSRVDVMLERGKPRLEASGGVYQDLGLVDGDANANAVKLAQPDATTRAFLEGLIARALEPRPATPPLEGAKRPAAPKPPKRIKVPPACEDAAQCGLVAPFGNTPYWTVVVAHSCGDACYTTRQLYDPKAKAFVSISEPGVTSPEPLSDASNEVLGAIVSLDGSAFVMGGQVYRFGHAPVAPRLPDGVTSLATGGGWLGGQSNQE